MVRDCGLQPDDVERREHDIVHRVLDPRFRLPTLPAVAAEVMALANGTDVTFRQVDRVVRRDPLIAARVLTVANSPAFRANSPIVSLRSAMMRMGWQTLRDVLWQAMAEACVFRGPGGRRFRTLRLHGVAVAHIARRLAHDASLSSEHAFASGLLHDLGRSLAMQVTAGEEGLSPAQEQCIVDAVHTSVGARIAQSWGLPDEIVQTVTHHHAWDPPRAAQRPSFHVGDEPPMSLVIAAAEHVAYHHGFGDRQHALDGHGLWLLSRLGIADDDVDPLLEQTENLHLEMA